MAALAGIFVDTGVTGFAAVPGAICPGALVADICNTQTFARANRKIEVFDRILSLYWRGTVEVVRFFPIAWSGCIAFTGQLLGKMSLGGENSPLGGGVTVGCPIFINRIFAIAWRETKEILRTFALSWRIPIIFVVRTLPMAWKAGIQIDKVFPLAWSLFDAWIKQGGSAPDTFVDEPDSAPDVWVKQSDSEPDDWSS